MNSNAYFSHNLLSFNCLFIYLFIYLHIKVKVKFMLVPALKAPIRNLHILTNILKLRNRGRWVVRLTPRPPLHLRKNLPYTRWITGRFGSRTCPKVLEKKRPCPAVFRLSARSHHTDCTVQYPTVSAISNRWSYFRIFQFDSVHSEVHL